MNPSFRRYFLLLVVASFLGFALGAKAGPVVADSGFEVEPNGFSFPNYGNTEGYRNLDSNQRGACLATRSASSARAANAS